MVDPPMAMRNGHWWRAMYAASGSFLARRQSMTCWLVLGPSWLLGVTCLASGLAHCNHQPAATACAPAVARSLALTKKERGKPCLSASPPSSEKPRAAAQPRDRQLATWGTFLFQLTNRVFCGDMPM